MEDRQQACDSLRNLAAKAKNRGSMTREEFSAEFNAMLTLAVKQERERCAKRMERFVSGLADYVEREEGARHVAAIRKGD